MSNNAPVERQAEHAETSRASQPMRDPVLDRMIAAVDHPRVKLMCELLDGYVTGVTVNRGESVKSK